MQDKLQLQGQQQYLKQQLLQSDQNRKNGSRSNAKSQLEEFNKIQMNQNQVNSNIIRPNNTSNTNNFNDTTSQTMKINLTTISNQLYKKSRQLERQIKENQWKQFQQYKEGLQKIKINKRRIEAQFRRKFQQLQAQVQKFQKQYQDVDDPLQKIQKAYQNKQLSFVQHLTKQEKINRVNLILSKQKNMNFPQGNKFQQKNVLKQKSKQKGQQLQETRYQKESFKDTSQIFFAKELSITKTKEKINQIIAQNLKGFKFLSQIYSKLIQKIAQIKKTIFQNIPEILFEMVIYLISNLYKVVKSLLQSILEQQLHISSSFRNLLRQKIEDQIQQIEINENAIRKNRISSMEAIMNEKLKLKQNSNSDSQNNTEKFDQQIKILENNIKQVDISSLMKISQFKQALKLQPLSRSKKLQRFALLFQNNEQDNNMMLCIKLKETEIITKIFYRGIKQIKQSFSIVFQYGSGIQQNVIIIYLCSMYLKLMKLMGLTKNNKASQISLSKQFSHFKNYIKCQLKESSQQFIQHKSIKADHILKSIKYVIPDSLQNNDKQIQLNKNQQKVENFKDIQQLRRQLLQQLILFKDIINIMLYHLMKDVWLKVFSIIFYLIYLIIIKNLVNNLLNSDHPFFQKINLENYENLLQLKQSNKNTIVFMYNQNKKESDFYKENKEKPLDENDQQSDANTIQLQQSFKKTYQQQKKYHDNYMQTDQEDQKTKTVLFLINFQSQKKQFKQQKIKQEENKQLQDKINEKNQLINQF